MTIPTEIKRLETAAKVAALTLANALIFQEQLSQSNTQVYTLKHILRKKDVATELVRHWDFICETINYVPIFRVASEILSQVPSGPGSDSAIRHLIEQALSISARRAALRHDLMGRIYHWLLHDAKYLGTYYTSVAAATLLLKLSLAPSSWGLDWSNLAQIRALRIGDLACGTGTLLMAACQAITDNHIRALAAAGKKVDESALRDLHQALMEDVIHGYDVLPSALHLTAATLGLLAPEIAFKKMQLYTLPIGKDASGTIHLGSIDYLSGHELATQFDLMAGQNLGVAAQVTGKGVRASVASVPSLSLCVMNPPFVRSVGGNLLFGSQKRDRAAMQAELKRRLNQTDGGEVLASTTAGLGSVFVAVGDRHMDDGARLSLVIPAAVTTGVSWEKTRRLIDTRYELETLVASHQADRWAFSENTELSEVLLVAVKNRGETRSKVGRRTTFVNLWKNPSTIAEALATAEAIAQTEAAEIGTPEKPQHGISSIKIGTRKIGEALSLPVEQVRGAPWIGCAFAHTELVRAALLLRQGVLLLPGLAPLALPIVRLGDIAILGPDRRDIYDGFDLADSETSFPAFWGHDADTVKTIRAEANRHLMPLARAKKGRPLRTVEILWPRAGRLMLAERMWLQTQRLTSVMLDAPALSNVWWPARFKHPDERREKALGLWLNSSLGILLLCAHRVPTRGPWVQFKKPVYEEMPVLDSTNLSEKAASEFAAAYDKLARLELSPLPEMASDPVRRSIDAVVSSVLKLPDLEPLRRLLGSEPIIANTSLIEEAEEGGEIDREQISLF
jgi:hypothetical protein